MMISWWHYLLLVNFYLILFFVFFKRLLRKETFFQLNRVYLVAAVLLSFLIPLIQSDWVHRLFITQRVKQSLYATIDPGIIYRVKPVESNPLTLGQLLGFIYLAGALVLAARLIYQLFKLRMQIGKGMVKMPFSFFNKLSVEETLAERDTILAHEQVHASQWHSADVLLIEAITIINWFNPVVYLYRTAIKHVHEFIADRKALETGTSKADYAMLLLSQTFGTRPHQLTNTFFNQSLLRQRIMMLNQDKSKRRALLKYGLSAPLFAAMLIFSSATVNNSNLVLILNKNTEKALSVTAVHFSKQASSLTTKALVGFTGKKVSVPLSPAKLPAESSATALPTKEQKDVEVNTSVYDKADVVPAFPGGVTAFNRFLAENIRYPEQAKAANASGRVFISFVIEKDGILSNFKSLRDPGSGLADEAIRVLNMSPRWSPGIQGGSPVRVKYVIPVNFLLENDKPVDTIRIKTNNVQRRQLFLIKTSNSNSSDTIKRSNINEKALDKVVINVKQPTIGDHMLIMVDGKEITRADLNKINAKNIANVSVFKDGEKLYGEKAKNGVISITMKGNTGL